MADFNTTGAKGAEHAADVVNLLGEGGSAGVFAVKVLAADADADNPVMAILGKGRLESGFFGRIVVCICGPDADEEFCVCGDGSRDGLWKGKSVGIWISVFLLSRYGEANIGERITVGGGVEAGRRKVAWEGLHRCEVFCPVRLGLAGTSGGEIGTEVEAFPVSGCEWNYCSEKSEGEGWGEGLGEHCGNQGGCDK